MSRRQKLEKFHALGGMPHVFQNYSYDRPVLIDNKNEERKLAGVWNKIHFRRVAPLILELACGRGEYSIGLAKLFPRRNYVGMDIKGARIYKGATIATKEGLSQVAFIRSKIECIDHFFSAGEVDEIWIVFPDPFLKSKKANRRLTAPPFLARYKNLLKIDGSIKLKTDSPELYEYTMDVIEHNPSIRIKREIKDIHNADHNLPELNILTYYERQHIENGRKINYVEFTFDD